MRHAIVPILLLTAALAGCSGDAPEEELGVQLGDGSTVSLGDVETRDGFGAISGVVVDAAIRPVPDALVALKDGAETTTAADGSFVLPDVAPGLHLLVVSAEGFETTQASSSVTEGEVTITKVFLPLDTSPQPYHTTYKFDAFVDASVGLVNWGADLVAGDVVPTCRCAFNFSVDQRPAAFVLEAIWEDSIGGKPDSATSYYFTLTSDDPFEIDSAYVSSPAYWTPDSSIFPEEARDYTVSLYPDDVWPAYNQAYQVFVTVFYLEGPPEGWSFVEQSAEL